MAISLKNETIFTDQKILVQELENNLGINFKVVVLKRAFCTESNDFWSLKSTWFPGFAWKICWCPKCSGHIGWMFEPVLTATQLQKSPTEEGFFVIILNRVIAESCKFNCLIYN